jgi:hypothetical protein
MVDWMHQWDSKVNSPLIINMSAIDTSQFFEKMHLHKNQIQITTSDTFSISPPTPTPNPTPTFSSHAAILEYYVRPQEVQSCSWSVDKQGNHPIPHECACADVPNTAACQSGYKTVKNEVHQATLESDPNSAIEWCVRNVPSPYKSDITSNRSWTLGCLSGIRGVHKNL